MLKAIKNHCTLITCTSLLIASSTSFAQDTAVILDGVQPFAEDFESLGLTSDTDTSVHDDLAVGNWMTGATVFQNTTAENYPGNYIYFYGWYDAPNNSGPSWSAVAEGDDTKDLVGTQYLNIFTDYNNEGAHLQGQVVNGFTAKRFIISEYDIGKTLTFSFDAKRPEFSDPDSTFTDQSSAVGNGCGLENCRAGAFIKTLGDTDNDPITPPDQTNYITEGLETTEISQSEWTSFSKTFDLSDADLIGQELIIGFEASSTLFKNTGVYYDNVSLSAVCTAIDGCLEESDSANVPLPTFALVMFAGLLSFVGINRIRKHTV